MHLILFDALSLCCEFRPWQFLDGVDLVATVAQQEEELVNKQFIWALRVTILLPVPLLFLLLLLPLLLTLLCILLPLMFLRLLEYGLQVLPLLPQLSIYVFRVSLECFPLFLLAFEEGTVLLDPLADQLI